MQMNLGLRYCWNRIIKDYGNLTSINSPISYRGTSFADRFSLRKSRFKNHVKKRLTVTDEKQILAILAQIQFHVETEECIHHKLQNI